MAKANRQLKKFNKELQWSRGLRVSVTQGENSCEIWECEKDVWAAYFGRKESEEAKYLNSFVNSIDYILDSAATAGMKLEGLKKSIIRDTKFAIGRGFLSETVMSHTAANVSEKSYARAKYVHERVKHGQVVEEEKEEFTPCETNCCCPS